MPLSKTYRMPREIDEREIVFDPRPKSAQEAAEEMIKDMKEAPESSCVDYLYDWRHANALAPPVEVEMPPNPIDRIAAMIRDLTYGEMIEFADELWYFREVVDINKDTLPDILHRWAKTRE